MKVIKRDGISQSENVTMQNLKEERCKRSEKANV